MARRIEHRSDFGHPADRVHAAMTDESCLRERLAAIGGRHSELVSYASNGSTTKVVMRQGIDPEYLPSVVRRVAPDGVTIERTETWDDGRSGAIHAAVHGMPGSFNGRTTLADTAGGSELVLQGDIRVSVPLIGGKIESVIAEQLGRLLRTEAKFTNRWLESH